MARKVDFRESEFGKYADAIYLCELAGFGPIAYSQDALYEYRVHPGQDVKVRDSEYLRRHDRELLRIAEAEARIGRKVRRAIAASQTKRAYGLWADRFKKERTLRSIFAQAGQDRPDIFSYAGFLQGTFEYVAMSVMNRRIGLPRLPDKGGA
ncbi:MAG: hypothetical protein NT137_07540 [Methanomassiliicoccales archaeon]|nr:hypothetical protein [Methanomassiliicoccales archaeon]